MAIPFKRILSFLPGGFLVALSSVTIEYEGEDSFTLSADGWLVEFDKASQTVSCSGKAVASFRSIQTVDVEHFINGKRFEWWVLSLALQRGKKIFVGRSTDGAEISIAAAHTATVMSKLVKSIERVGL